MSWTPELNGTAGAVGGEVRADQDHPPGADLPGDNHRLSVTGTAQDHVAFEHVISSDFLCRERSGDSGVHRVRVAGLDFAGGYVPDLGHREQARIGKNAVFVLQIGTGDDRAAALDKIT